jgi:hypothetical protein
MSKGAVGSLSNWYARLRQKGDAPCSPYAIKACVEALYSSYGKVYSAEAPAIALYEYLSFKKIEVDGCP